MIEVRQTPSPSIYFSDRISAYINIQYHKWTPGHSKAGWELLTYVNSFNMYSINDIILSYD